jgi:hypothetical protein
MSDFHQRECTVRFIDRRGVERSTRVNAASTYEAVCRAWAIFKGASDTEEESYKAKEFIVEMWDEPKTFVVNLDKLLASLLRGRHGRDENPRKKWLRKLLDERSRSGSSDS